MRRQRKQGSRERGRGGGGRREERGEGVGMEREEGVEERGNDKRKRVTNLQVVNKGMLEQTISSSCKAKCCSFHPPALCQLLLLLAIS